MTGGADSQVEVYRIECSCGYSTTRKYWTGDEPRVTTVPSPEYLAQSHFLRAKMRMSSEEHHVSITAAEP